MNPSYPLAWPPGWPRTKKRKRGPFQMPPQKARYELKRELDLLGATNITINSNVMTRADGMPYANQPKGDMDPGVVLFFTLKGREQCIPCDKWDSIEANLRAIGMAVEAIRGMERWGTSQMVEAAFSGFTALPAGATDMPVYQPPKPWHEVLHVSADAPREIIDAVYKAEMKISHPDMPGGSAERFKEVQRAYKEATK
jgi:hypothetical protein